MVEIETCMDILQQKTMTIMKVENQKLAAYLEGIDNEIDLERIK